MSKNKKAWLSRIFNRVIVDFKKFLKGYKIAILIKLFVL